MLRALLAHHRGMHSCIKLVQQFYHSQYVQFSQVRQYVTAEMDMWVCLSQCNN